MSKFDDLFGNLATKLIDQTFGTDGTVVRESATYDVTTGDNTRSTTNYAVKISPPAPIKQSRMTDGSLFQMDDLETIVARQGLAITPNPRTDKLTWRGDTFQIVAVEPFVSGDQDAAYRLIVRR